MALLTASDFNTHIYPEIVTAIHRGDSTLLDKAIEAAESKAKSYLDKYNIEQLFTATGEARKSDLVSICKDLACWEFCKLANPNINLDFFKELHDDAVKWLKDIQAGRSVPYQWPAGTDSTTGEQSTFFKIGGNTRRDTHY